MKRMEVMLNNIPCDPRTSESWFVHEDNALDRSNRNSWQQKSSIYSKPISQNFEAAANDASCDFSVNPLLYCVLHHLARHPYLMKADLWKNLGPNCNIRSNAESSDSSIANLLN